MATDPFTAAAAAVEVASGIASLFGGGGDEGQSASSLYKDQREHTEKYGMSIRRGAEKAGFNPLTYLGAMGPGGAIPAGAQVAADSPLAGFQAIAGGLASYGEAVTEEAKSEQAKKKAEQQLAHVKKEQQQAGGSAGVLKNTEKLAGPVTGRIRPKARNFHELWRDGDNGIPVVLMDGTPGYLPSIVAKRLRLTAGDYVSAGDMEELFGDELGQGIIAPRIPGAVQQNLGGLFGYGVEERKDRLAAKGIDPINNHDPEGLSFPEEATAPTVGDRRRLRHANR